MMGHIYGEIGEHDKGASMSGHDGIDADQANMLTSQQNGAGGLKMMMRKYSLSEASQ